MLPCGTTSAASGSVVGRVSTGGKGTRNLKPVSAQYWVVPSCARQRMVGWLAGWLVGYLVGLGAHVHSSVESS